MGTENTDPEVIGASGPSGSLMSRKIQAQPKEKGAKKRTNGDISPQQGDIKHKKRKAKEPTAPSPPAPPPRQVRKQGGCEKPPLVLRTPVLKLQQDSFR